MAIVGGGNEGWKTTALPTAAKGVSKETVGKARRKVGDALKDLGNTLRK